MGNVINIAKVLTLRISLDDVKPEIWRRFAVRDDFSVFELHEIIQDVMGWTDSHLFSFYIKGTEYTDEETIAELGRGKDAEDVSLRSMKLKKGDTFTYIYDFGDDWRHTLKVESVSPPDPDADYPLCLDGARSCPPEDCGGPPGYEDLLNVLKDPDHEGHEHMKEWAGPFFDPEDFDPELTNIVLHTDVDDEDYFPDEESEEDLAGEMKILSREHMHFLWEAAKEDRTDDLTDEDRLLAEIMIEHEDEFFNDFEFADLLSGHDFDPETDVNPFLHITLHAIVENQLRDKEPVEVYQFYNAMRNKKVSRHDTVHLIAEILVPLLFSGLKENRNFDTERYKSLLKKCKSRKPETIPDFIENMLGS